MIKMTMMDNNYLWKIVGVKPLLVPVEPYASGQIAESFSPGNKFKMIILNK